MSGSRLKIFVKDAETGDFDAEKMAVISLCVTEHDGCQHVRFDCDDNDLADALLNSDVVILNINPLPIDEC